MVTRRRRHEVHLSTPAPLEVAVVPPPKRETAEEKAKRERREKLERLAQLGLWFLIGVVLAGTIGLWWLYLFPQEPPALVDCSSAVPGLAVSLAYPSYLATGDEGQIAVTVINQGFEPISGTLVVAFLGPLAAQMTGETKNEVTFSALKPGVQQTQHIKFTLIESGRLVAPEAAFAHMPALRFTLQVPSEAGVTRCSAEEWRIERAPIHGLQRGFNWLLGGSTLVTTLSTFFWGRIKKLLGIEEEKKK